MDKAIIKTQYNDTIQYWLATIEEEHFSLRELISSENFNTFPVIRYVDNLKALWEHKTVTFTPITSDTMDSYYSREFHRGYDNDADPFIVRGKNLPELVARIYNHSNRNNISFESHYRLNPLTPGQQKWLQSTFSDQLSAAYTKELVDHLVKRAIERMQNDMAAKLATLKDNIDKFRDHIFSH